ncbi:putative serologically defined colon cancer antigen 1 protein [Rosellinia necatrix]|uniref:Putative serologically defined colon cancer antigen 1 protein n=1 Tax=Rosellinia necatrix TaxID=77044 RepID=A0A1W2TIP8_ROSNE|nr:putative serologically defined colon cancer antigen 1 protein [Rosellinia necatrix]
MALPQPLNPAGGNRRRPLTPTAAEFTPKMNEAKEEVLEASFITQTVPNAHRYAGIVALCTIPEDRADMNDLGWHVADFLAFRALLCGDNHPRAQTWLTHCDIHALVQSDPQRYVHGGDRRVVGSAAGPAQRQGPGISIEREDNIQVETSAEALKEKFITAVKEKLGVAKKMNYPLLLIVCGLTSPEQDIYFGKLDTDHRYTMNDFRRDLGDGINDVQAVVVTPSLFSAGWQTNVSFGRLSSTEVRGNRFEFLARQLGGVFAKDLVRSFLGWECPILDEGKINPLVRETERFPGPAWPSDEVKALISQLQMKLQSYLMGGMSRFHMDHSFSFDKSTDEWAVLIGPRDKSLGYRALDSYAQKWAKLPYTQSPEPAERGLKFLGNAFGGTRTSQLNHIRYLIEESYLAWPDHWESNFGQETKNDLERFMNMGQPDDLDCHKVFNVLEHRTRTSTLADIVVRYFDLPIPHNQRSRDWDYLKWKQELSEADRSSLIKYFSGVFDGVPGPNMPPGVNFDDFNRLQRRLESGTSYVRAALGIRFLTSKDASKMAIGRIESFLQEVKAKQVELMTSNLEVYSMCCSWLTAIKMPIRELGSAVTVGKEYRKVTVTEEVPDILDGDDDYDVYQDDGAHLNKEASSMLVGDSHAEITRNQQVPSVSLTPIALVGQHYGVSAAKHLENPVTQPGPDIVAAMSPILALQARDSRDVDFPKEVVDLATKESRLIMALETTNEKTQREKLTAELLELLHGGDDMADTVKSKSPNGVGKSAAPKATRDEVINTSPLAGFENDDEHRGRAKHRNTQRPPLKTELTARRKTPPHLRGIRGATRD